MNQDGGHEQSVARPNLALFGAPPAFEQELYVGRPNPIDREAFFERLNGVLDRNWLTNAGPLVREFETRIAQLCGVRHCVAMCNGTVALEIAIRALGLRGEVIVPSYTFVATAHALQWQEITPVFCDIDPETHLIDPKRAAELITPRTSGIIGVHTWGRVCDVEGLTALAEEKGLRLLFDAAHALGCSRGGESVGNFGEAEVLSFHATKYLNTFEGGAVLTNSDELAEKMRLMKNFGFIRTDEVIHIGTNGKMSEVSAAMGLTALDSIDRFTDHNRQNHETYRESLQDVPGVRFLEYAQGDKQNYQYAVVEVDPHEAGLSRDELVAVLHKENVLARRYFWPGCHRMEPYRSLFPHAGLLLPETERVAERVIVLPNGMAIDSDIIRTIARILRDATSHADDVRKVVGRARVHLSPPLPRGMEDAPDDAAR